MSLIEPGYFKTNFNHEMLHSGKTYSDYNNIREVIQSSINQAIAQGENPEKVARLIVSIAQNPAPRLRYRVGNDAQWLPPDRLFRFAARKRFNIA